MKKIIYILILCLLISLTSNLFSSNKEIEFNKAIAYYLLEDIELAKRYLGIYFKNNPNSRLKSSFNLLFANENWEATKKFKHYLESNRLSPMALVGIALSTKDMKNNTSIENLKRALRLSSSYSPAYLCLGMLYMKDKNFPAAEKYLKKTLKYSNITEYRIILGYLYIKTEEPKLTLELLKKEADKSPDNFYLNFLTALAYFKQNNLEDMRQYIQSAVEISPKNNEAKLLLAKYFLNKKEFKKAKSILKKLKFENYNLDYIKTYAHVLLELKDKKALKYLYEFFSQRKWDEDINKLFGLYFLKKNKKHKIQNWINRAILSGNKIDELKKLFPEEFEFPEYKALSFFDVKKIKWVSKELLLVVGNKKSGFTHKIFFIDTKNKKIINTLKYQGKFQDFFISKNKKNIIFSTSAVKDEKVILYCITKKGRNFKLNLMAGYTIKMPSVLVGFNKNETLAYITDASVSHLSFESPFSQLLDYGKRKPVYPRYPFLVYKYNFLTKSFVKLKYLNQIEKAPIRDIKKYSLVKRAYQTNSDICQLIQKGQKFDLTSSQNVKIHFSRDLSSFIIYLSDLKNAFQATVYNNYDNKVAKFDETMFLGENNYAEIEILNFNPKRAEINIMTKDNNRNLINFNYNSFLYKKLAKKLLRFYYNPTQNIIYFIEEKNNKLYYAETNMQAISLKPFSRRKITSRKDINNIIHCDDYNKYVTTYNGELLKIDENYKTHYLSPSLEGVLYEISPDNINAAAFINEKLYILNWFR
jgi:tetratricopeptide (TPR) repeat protein